MNKKLDYRELFRFVKTALKNILCPNYGFSLDDVDINVFQKDENQGIYLWICGEKNKEQNELHKLHRFFAWVTSARLDFNSTGG